MLARLWANEIIDRNKTYNEAPRLLKEQVRIILVNEGYSELII